MAQGTRNSARLRRWLPSLVLVAAGALLANGCLLEKMRTDPGLDLLGAGADRAEGGGGSNGGFPGGNDQAGGVGGRSEPAAGDAGAAAAGPLPAGGQGGVSGLHGDAGTSEGGTRGGEVTVTAGDGGQPSGSAGAPLGGTGGTGSTGGGANDCLYTESADLDNDYALGTPEETGLSTSGAVSICGTTQITHYQSFSQKVDTDSYYIDVPTAQTVLVTLQYEAMPGYFVELEVDGVGQAATGRRASMAVADTSILLALGAGRTRLAVRAHFRDQPTLPELSYQLRVRPFDIEQHCPRASAATAAKTFTEKGDGANNTGNDVYRVTAANQFSVLTPDTTDKAELFVFSPGVEIGKNYLVSGIAGAVAQSDDYADGDYYQINAADADQLIVRLDWDDPSTDLDLFLFDFSDTASAFSKLKQNGGSEVLSFSVLQPNYFRLWVGGSAGGQYPKPYSITICGEKFVL